MGKEGELMKKQAERWEIVLKFSTLIDFLSLHKLVQDGRYIRDGDHGAASAESGDRDWDWRQLCGLWPQGRK